MGWNYRVLKKQGTYQFPNGFTQTWTTYSIHEVYYNDDGSVKMWSVDPIHPGGETPQDLIGDVELMYGAFEKSILQEIDSKLIEVEE